MTDRSHPPVARATDARGGAPADEARIDAAPDAVAGLPAVIAAALAELQKLPGPNAPAAPDTADATDDLTRERVDRVMRAVRVRPAPRPTAGRVSGDASSGVPGALPFGRPSSRRAARWWPAAIAASVAVAAGLAGSAWQNRATGWAARSRSGRPVVADDAAGVATQAAPGTSAPRAGALPARTARFLVVAPGARRVAVVGDFNGWRAGATPMRRDADTGVWTAHVALPEGRYVYAYVVDGARWMADPDAPLAPADGFGRQSSVLVLTAQYAAR